MVEAKTTFYYRLTFQKTNHLKSDLNYYFFKVVPLKEDIFLTIITHITNYNLSHVGPLLADFMYCIYTCLSDLWVLFMQLNSNSN